MTKNIVYDTNNSKFREKPFYFHLYDEKKESILDSLFDRFKKNVKPIIIGNSQFAATLRTCL